MHDTETREQAINLFERYLTTVRLGSVYRARRDVVASILSTFGSLKVTYIPEARLLEAVELLFLLANRKSAKKTWGREWAKYEKQLKNGEI